MPPLEVSDFKDFLNAAGKPVESPVSARKLASFFTQVIDAATRVCPSLNRDIGVRCRKPHCKGSLRVSLPSADAEIAWYCPICLQKGVIRNWKGTKWDHAPHRKD